MLPNERKDIIRDILYEDKIVRVLDLSSRFHVSPETIRRDLDFLAKEGIITKIYGGATFRPQVTQKVPSQTLKNIMVYNKDCMAREAKNHINQNDCIFLGYSTTIFSLCPYLKDMNLTVVTNSLSIMQFFASSATVRVENVGGQYLKEFDAFSSYHTIKNIGCYSFDKVFLSCQSLDLKKGMCDQHELICGLQQKVMDNSNSIYLLADHTKLNQTAYISYGDLSKIELLITDQKLDNETKAQLENLSLPYVVADS